MIATAVRAPDLIEAVLGFRQWRLRDGRLLSLQCDEPWLRPTLVARCLRGTHPDADAPAHDCACGLHAWYQQPPRLASAGTSDLVAGAIVLWGRMELHGGGMRAQFARLVALELPLTRGAKRRRVIEIAERLGVAAVPHRRLKEVAREHGAPIPDALKPPRTVPEELNTPFLFRRRLPQ